MRCHHLDPGILSCLPSKVPDENHIGKSESESFLVKIFWEQKMLLFCQSFAFLRNLDLNQQTFHLFRDIYLFGETFIFSAVPPSPQLAMPLSVLTASLGKNLLPLYI